MDGQDEQDTGLKHGEGEVGENGTMKTKTCLTAEDAEERREWRLRRKKTPPLDSRLRGNDDGERKILSFPSVVSLLL